MEYNTITKFTISDITPGVTLASTIFNPTNFYLIQKSEDFSVTANGQVAHQGQELWSNKNTIIKTYVLLSIIKTSNSRIQPQENLGRTSFFNVTFKDIFAIKNPI